MREKASAGRMAKQRGQRIRMAFTFVFAYSLLSTLLPILKTNSLNELYLSSDSIESHGEALGASHYAPPSSAAAKEERCALCFFGLPRSYKTMVFPSIRNRILKHNQRCDIFVHYFYQRQEQPGRFNDGGRLDPDEILLLADYAKGTATSKSTTIQLINDTDAAFLEKRKTELHRYHTSKNIDGNWTYAPWKEADWAPSSADNVIRQWHSIDAAFTLMERYELENNINYTRVAMLRNDVLYMTPINIMQLDKDTSDVHNRHFVIPSFANYPVNDRMIYGPYEAVKIWSTKRFELLEDRAKDPEAAGYVLHSERFMRDSIIPAMEELGFVKSFNPDICFARTRAKSVVLIKDCLRGNSTVRGMPQLTRGLLTLTQRIIGRKCKRPTEIRLNNTYIIC